MTASPPVLLVACGTCLEPGCDWELAGDQASVDRVARRHPHPTSVTVSPR